VTVDSFVHRELGLTDDELAAIVGHLGREPTYTELAMFSVMWSEHCSYKSSRVHLRDLPTEGDHVVVGPGEGAGIVEVAPGVSVAWKLESHNHPSFVEPFNGAATGIGGIVRDVLSMGARPVALMDSLRFGPPDDARNRYLLDAVVHGISSYGNSIGVPTVGGETVFDDCYSENPLVNAACLGVVEHSVMRGRADGPGNALVLIGSSTGRDGIGGASVLASAEFDGASLDKRPSVQVGDPFTEKLLIEASLELIRRGLLVGFQDLGAGGIACPSSEMAAKAGTGVRVQVDRVPRREPDMEAFEVMISESQERMLAVVRPEDCTEVVDVCTRWGLTAAVVGEVTPTGRLEVADGADVVADVPAAALAGGAPEYRRPVVRPSWVGDLASADPGDAPPDDLAGAFLSLLESPVVASKRWIWEQYDHMIFLGTIRGPGADAAVVRLAGTDAAVAVSTDGPGRYCILDPYEGARLAVAEAARNVACVGGRPLAITNCLNFGNPERPEVMWQFSEVVRGIADACRSLGTPVTGGNVSFYNETNGRAIYPTPVIGMLGALESASAAIGPGFAADGDAIVLLGSTDGRAFAGSEYARVVNGALGGRLGRVDLERERAVQNALSEANRRSLVASAHDVSAGGLGVALAVSAFSGGRGFSIDAGGDEPHRELFSESPTRVVFSCAQSDVDELIEICLHAGIQARPLGEVGGSDLDFGCFRVPVNIAKNAWEAGLVEKLSVTIG
jgi:phosphoribosylformylglycinamidine synthase subunit PurL